MAMKFDTEEQAVDTMREIWNKDPDATIALLSYSRVKKDTNKVINKHPVIITPGPCDKSCSPSDFHPDGKCGREGCIRFVDLSNRLDTY